MAKNQTGAEQKNKEQTGTKAKDGKKEKKAGLFSILFPFLMVVAIICGIWSYFIRSNTFGLGEKFRPNLKNIPIINMVLPPNPDPEAAEYMSEQQLATKYEEYRKKSKDYKKQVDELNKKLKDVQRYKDSAEAIKAENEGIRAFLEKERKNILAERKVLQAEKLKFATAVKNKDKIAVAEYIEKMDAETVKAIYEQIARENAVSDQVKNYVKTFELMEPASAAALLESMGVSNMDLVANIMKLMKKQAVADIMSNMDPVFCGNLQDRIAVEYPIYPEE